MRALSLEALAALGPFIAPILAAQDSSSRPRGVGPEFAKHYKDPSTFTCISNPSFNLPIASLNDDYCDCPDGSDEPGTSACSHLNPRSPRTPADISSPSQNSTPALPGFYCKNKGHQPTYIPFTYVNDGICDYDLCCDGSDEWAQVGGVKCEDKCTEIGKEWRKMNDFRMESMSRANRKRKELAAEAQRLRKEVEDRITSLKQQIENDEVKVEGLKKELEEVEKKEKAKMVKSSGDKKPGPLSVVKSLAQNRIDELKEALMRTRDDKLSLKDRINELELVLSTFKEEYNPNFNDEGVKRAVRAWEDYAAKDKSGVGDAAHDRDMDELLKSDEENGLNWKEFEDAAESDVDVLYQFESYLPPPLRIWLDTKLRALRVYLIENGVIAGTADTPTDSPILNAAKNKLSIAETSLTNARNDLKRDQDDLTNPDPYGPNEIFRALRGQCVEVDSGEYTYEMCWLTSTTQKPKKGGGHTGMGNFQRFDKIITDDDLPADGRGLGTGERWVIQYGNGQHCWNGPNRSTMVVLACAEKDEIWKVAEEEKCVYRMEVGTPAVCEAASSGNGGSAAPDADGKKDEL